MSSEQTSMEMGEMKLSIIQKAVGCKEVKDSKNNFDAEYVFDAFAERYDKWYDKPFGKSAFNLERAAIEKICKGFNEPSLEIGVGTGRFAVALDTKYGIDKSARVLNFAKKRGIEVVRGTGENLPFRSEIFGTVFILVTLCFVDNPLRVLEEASKVLKSDGSIILGLILKETPWASFYIKKGEAGNVFYGIAKFFSFKELKAMVKKAGLKIMETSSTIFQAPTENPLRFEPPRKGYYEEAGFVVVKLGKISSKHMQEVKDT
jgi:SAM-dependent methyltransferase